MYPLPLRLTSCSRFVASLLLLQQLLWPASHADGAPRCKVTPGSPNWPTDQEWAALEASLSLARQGDRSHGGLLTPTPPAAACHASQSFLYNETHCTSVVQPGWKTFAFHVADPVSTCGDIWNNDTCLPVSDDVAPCSRAGYPGYVVNASSAADVSEAVKFAAKHGIRLVVKSTGHDFLGRSGGPDSSLSIWTHHLAPPGMPIVLHDAGTFVPQGCPADVVARYRREGGTAMSAGPGTLMGQIFETLDAQNLTTVGGGCDTVSLGGYLTGGGHSALSPRRGLAADLVLEAEMVMADGETKVVNECQDPELFWAIRGGGGSTFGVLTRVTMRTFPTPSVVSLSWSAATPSNASDSAPLDMMAFVISRFPELEAAGFSGYSVFFANTTHPADPTQRVATLSAAMIVQDTSNTADVTATWDRIVSSPVRATWPGHFTYFADVQAYPSYFAAWNPDVVTMTAGGTMFLSSRLLDAESLTTRDPELFKEGLRAMLAPDGYVLASLFGGRGVWNGRGSNAVGPAWRKAVAHCLSAVTFQPRNATARAEAVQMARAMAEPWRRLAPDMGAYLNEANPYEVDWQHQFWGDNYERLVQVKRAVDPDDVFWCYPCVGGERWSVQDDGRLCRTSED